MNRVILKDQKGAYLNLDGGHVVVKNGAGADASLETELAALRQAINALASCADALVFRGLVNNENGLPETGYKAGWTYKITQSGIYAGQQCEPGDLAICVKNHDADAASPSDWQIVQANIDGAVTGPASAVSGNIASFSGSTGKIIADSGISSTDIDQALEWRHQHANSGTLALFGQNTGGELTFSGKPVGVGLVDCAVISAGDPVPENLAPYGVIFEIQEG